MIALWIFRYCLALQPELLLFTGKDIREKDFQTSYSSEFKVYSRTNSLLVIRWSIFFTRYSLIYTCHSLLFTWYSLLFCHYSLLFTRYSLLVTSFLIGITGKWLNSFLCLVKSSRASISPEKNNAMWKPKKILMHTWYLHCFILHLIIYLAFAKNRFSLSYFKDGSLSSSREI